VYCIPGTDTSAVSLAAYAAANNLDAASATTTTRRYIIFMCMWERLDTGAESTQPRVQWAYGHLAIFTAEY
jgi:hypothetical protein